MKKDKASSMSLKTYNKILHRINIFFMICMGAVVLLSKESHFEYTSVSVYIVALLFFPLQVFFPRFYRKKKFSLSLIAEGLVIAAAIAFTVLKYQYAIEKAWLYDRLLLVGILITIALTFVTHYMDDDGHTEGKIPSPFFRKDDGQKTE